ncbi:MAG: histidine kinase [Flavobacteriaceae bacterium]|nr:histidine kinase [Flavobacteriaceae bacterium]
MNLVFQKVFFLFLFLSAFVLQSQNSHLEHFTVADGLPQQEVIDIAQDQFGYLLIVTKGGEITRYDGEKFELSAEGINSDIFNDDFNVSHDELPETIKYKIKKSTINKIIKDRQSNIWIASSKGLYKLTENNFERFLQGENIIVTYNSGSELLIGTDNGLFKIDTKGTHQLLKNYEVNAITTNKLNQIFIGTNKNIFVIDSLKVIDTIAFGNKINKLLIQNNKIWVSTISDGISSFSYDIATKSVFNLKHFDASEGIYDLSITDIQVDRIGRLWYISKKGFLGFIDKNIVKHLGKILTTDVPIGTLIFNDTKIFLGTHGKGVWWSEVNNELEFKKLIGTKKLYSENINQLLFDSKDNLWVGTHKGVDKVLLDDKTQIQSIKHFGRNDGFLGIETTKNTISEDSNGDLWFGTVNGLMKYEISENKKNFVRPSIYFENIEVVYNEVDTIDFASWTNSNKTLNLKPSDNHLSFSFRTVDLNYSTEIQYRWRLNTENWSPWAKDRKVNYSSQNSGNYVFEVQSKINNSQESRPIKFQFNIGLPLYKKLWFQLFVLGVFLLFGWLLLRNYLKKIKAKNQREQEKLKMENNLLALEQKALQLQMNPHFIFNVLNGIKALGVNDTGKMNITINKFATLLRQTLSNSRQENITLEEEIKTLKNYIEVEQLMNEKQFNYSIDIASDTNIEEILIPPMLVQPFVENAIAHGFRGIDRVGELKIAFAVKKEFLHCTVQDNGIGIEESKRRKVNASHQSMALEVTKERIESLSEKDTFKIEELKEEKGIVLGTKVSFKIPLLTDY